MAETNGSEVGSEGAGINEWTVMFFFAGDNALSALIVSQLKAIKDAGFQKNTDVLVYFDSNERGVPTKIYDVNYKRKKVSRPPHTMVGDGDNSFVPNLADDDITARLDSNHGPASAAISQALQTPDALNANEALKRFLDFCVERHPAEHYILFLVGHGIVVGNDAFLPDENPTSAISLLELHKILKDFSDQATTNPKGAGTFELLALHSCSMSAIEVAYQLKGTTAKYLMASEGISYVGSWPYRQLLKRMFKSIEQAKGAARRAAEAKDEDQDAAAKNATADAKELIEKLYLLSYHNAKDFMLAGYSLDLALCNLAEDKFTPLAGDIRELVALLKRLLLEKGVLKERVKELLLLAHWESQSYWGENFTDLYDFCRILRNGCASSLGMLDPNSNDEKLLQIKVGLEDIGEACLHVMDQLKPNASRALSDRFEALVIHSRNFGSKYQYSHGLSIYFPWSKPVDDDPVPALTTTTPRPVRVEQRPPGNGDAKGVQEQPPAAASPAREERSKSILGNYEKYAFTTDFRNDADGRDDSWLSFLNIYFEETRRATRPAEDEKDKEQEEKDGEKDKYAGESAEARAARESATGNESISAEQVPLFFNPFGGLSERPSPALHDNPTPSTGVECGCPSIKNYPTLSVTIKGNQREIKAVSISKELAIYDELLAELAEEQ